MKSLRLVLLGAFGFALTAVVGRATPTFTWTGLGASDDTTVSGNWLGGTPPSGSGGENLIFGDSARTGPRFPGNFTAQDITLDALTTGFFLEGVSNPTLTVTGHVNSTVGSGHFLVFSSVTLSLAAGAHNFDVQGGDIYVWGNLTGSGDIVKTGNRSLVIANADDANTYTGNITLTAGELAVSGDGALGASGSAGTITMNGGRLTIANDDADRAVTLHNRVDLGTNARFGRTTSTNILYTVGDRLTITGDITASASTVDVEKFNQVTFDGDVSGTNLVFNGSGTAILNGVNTHTGGTYVASGTVVFMNSVPAAGALKSVGSGYLGSGVALNMQSGFLDHFNKGATTGIVGFDSPDLTAPIQFSENIDLSGFHSAARLGTATAAIIDGTITPQGSHYQFGGRGTFTVNSNLTGARDVKVTDGLLLYLGGTNDYTGKTDAIAGGIIFNTASAIPVTAHLVAQAGGYVGQTESTGLGAATYLSLFDLPATSGVVGFDADNPVSGRVVSEAVDLSVFAAGAFLGTATNVTFTGPITPYNGEYRFTGFRDGQLTISTALSGTDRVVIGLDGDDISSVAAPGQLFSPSVTLTGPNTYSGGTTLQSGRLILADANALGTGALTIDYHWVENQPAGITTMAGGFVIPNAIDFNSSSGFTLGGTNDFTLAGNLTSSAGEGFEKVDANTVTLSGENSAYGGYINVRRGDMIFASNTAAGTGSLFLDDVDGFHGHAIFTSATPQMGSLSGRAVTSVDLGAGTLTINQANDDVYSGTIAGTGGLVKSGSGRLILDGTHTFTGGTTVDDGILLFTNAVPVAGALKSIGPGYLGTTLATNLQTDFLDRFNKGATTGIVGFDSADEANPTRFTDAIDLTGFDASARLGTATAAILDGTITPQAGDYRFGGRGTLTVNSNLTGSGNVKVYGGLQLFLSGTNDYTGDTEAIAGAIIFNTASAVPAAANLIAQSRGYIGQTESTGLSAATYLSLFNAAATSGVVGFDADFPVNGRLVSEAIDLSTFDPGAFLGSATHVTFDGTITPSSGEYRFTGFREGQLTVASVLSGSNSVVIGLDGNDISSVAAPGQVFSPSVTLTGPNTYSGGTTLQSGRLILGDANALGTGTLTLDYHSAWSQPRGLTTTAPGFVIPNAIDFDSSSGFSIGGANDFTLSGTLTSFYGEGFDKVGANVVTLSGNNGAFSGYINVRSGDIIFATDTAAGTGSLRLDDVDGSGSRAFFTSAAPTMGSLSGRSATSLDLGTGTLTIDQASNGYYGGSITGGGNLIKAGSGSLVLGGSNTYSGNTTVTDGTLVAAHNSALRGIVTVDGATLNVASGVTLPNVVSFSGRGGTLAGHGTFASAITIASGTRLSPGDSVGLLSFNSGLTVAPGGTLNIEIQTAGGARSTGFDSINVTGGLAFTATLGSPWTLQLSSLDPGGAAGAVADFDPGANYAWLIAQADGVTGFDAANLSIVSTGFTNSLAGGAFDVTMVGNDIFLNFTPVPEPSTYVLLALGLGAVVFPALRRRKRG